MKQYNIEMLRDTLAILERGYYRVNGEKIPLRLSDSQRKEIAVFLPQDIKRLAEDTSFDHRLVIGRAGVKCENADAYTVARKLSEDADTILAEKRKPVLVLNLANPVHPGGGVRRGAKAQEEDLCRKSSLLLSLESQKARAYYDYNESLHTFMGSDAIMITPYVEIIKDEKGCLLAKPAIVSVMTCAAPMVTYGKEDMTEEEYRGMIYNRILGMLTVAANLGYDRLVLGAFGCGAFANDAKVVSDLFYKAMKSFDYDGMTLKDFFRSIRFAVMDHSHSLYNYREFARNFDDFYREENAAAVAEAEKAKKAMEKHLDQIRGCLFGGAVGDALGYAVEFLDENQIFSLYGKEGITEYSLTQGKALISDDTQMTLFTANGILVGDTRLCLRGIGGDPKAYVPDAYYDWLKTQTTEYKRRERRKQLSKEGGRSWLLDVPELYNRRAPGITCLNALAYRKSHNFVESFIHEPINSSKGCGGVMRIAPVALRYRMNETCCCDLAALDELAAQLAAITHSHSLGYMPAAVISHIISRCISSAREMTLKEMVEEAKDTAKELFTGDEHITELTSLIEKAIQLAENDLPDLENIHNLGEGWVAEETMAIAIYCALRYSGDFSKAVIASVNHKGDSDSTGAVTGNILGALLGYEAIEDKWKSNLELSDVILEMADDLCHGCQMSEFGNYQDPAWTSKYIYMHRYEPDITRLV